MITLMNFNSFKRIFKNIAIIKRLYIQLNYFFFLKKKIIIQLDDSNIKFSQPKKKTIIFTLIETSHPVNFFLMLFAKILKIRGYNVLILVCDQFLGACEIKSIRRSKDPCYECKFNQKKIYPFFKIPIIKLSNFNNKNLAIKINNIVKRYKKNNYSFNKFDEFYYLNKVIKDSVLRYFYGDVYEDNQKEKFLKISIDHCKTAVYMHELSKIIDKKYMPSSVVSLMTSYSSWHPFFLYFKKRNKFRQIGFDKKICLFDTFKFFPSVKMFRDFLSRFKRKQLNQKENLEISNFLKKRFGSYYMNSTNSIYLENKKESKQIENYLNIKKNKINIFIFPNVFWDVGLSDRGGIFNSVLEWLFYTIDLLKNNSKYHIYIKPHPNEFVGMESLMGIKKIIQKKYGNSISNLTFIDRSLKVSTYELKSFIDLALVFNGTLNLEFMLLNVPVISIGTTSTKGIGFKKELKSKREYKKILIDKNYNFHEFLVRDRKKLMIFVYFWFIKKDLIWNKKNYYTHSINRFKGFNFKSLNDCNFSDTQTNSIVKFLSKGKQLF
jgi:hypothetical protein